MRASKMHLRGAVFHVKRSMPSADTRGVPTMCAGGRVRCREDPQAFAYWMWACWRLINEISPPSRCGSAVESVHVRTIAEGRGRLSQVLW